MINTLLIMAGAAIFVAAFPNYLRIIKNADTANKKYWKILLAFTVFFLFGYVFQAAIEIMALPFDYRAMMSMVYFFGAIYVFAVVWLAGSNMDDIRKRQEAETALRKRGEELDSALKQRNEELEKTKKELEEKVRDLEKFQTIAVGRELKMVEMKSKMSEIEKPKEGGV